MASEPSVVRSLTMTRSIDHDADDQIVLNDDSFDVACQVGNEAQRAGLEPQEELALCIRAYVQAEKERLAKAERDQHGG